MVTLCASVLLLQPLGLCARALERWPRCARDRRASTGTAIDVPFGAKRRALCQRCRVVCVVRCRLKKKHLSFVLRARSYCLLPVAFQPTEQCQRYHTYLCISGTPMRHRHDEGTATGAGTTTSTSSHMTGRRAVVVDGHTTMVLPAVQCFSCEASLLAESSA